MRTPILVCGGAGYVGSHVCKRLSEAGYLPVTYDDLSRGHRWAVQWGPLEIGDLAQPGRLDEVFRRYRPAAVMHFASAIEAGESVVDPARFYGNNVVNTLALLQAMRRAAVDRIVFSSSAAVYGVPHSVPVTEAHGIAPVNPYGVTKSVCEAMLRDFARAYHIRSISLRYFNAAGADPTGQIGEAHEPETHLIPLVLEAAAGRRPHIAVFGNNYRTSDGTCVRDYVHVSDLAVAHQRALQKLAHMDGAQAFNLGTGRGYTVREVIATASRAVGRAIPVRAEAPRPGDPPCLVADPALARSELDWAPAYADLETQIVHAWRWFRRYESMSGRTEGPRTVVPFRPDQRRTAEATARRGPAATS